MSGIIPAYAGSTSTTWPKSPSGKDHPRIRGEHTGESFSKIGITGSSPHTRGALIRSATLYEVSGIIPAYAGSTASDGSGGWGAWDHPRIRGEHNPCGHAPNKPWGSSPHTRGARAESYGACGETWIIPAYAGSTRRDRRGATSAAGSSPHTRGARGRRRVGWSWSGIIPAYAGSTESGSAGRPRRRDHPRIRGEHVAMAGFLPVILGSSPHTRGARTCRIPAPRSRRIIPAYAGSTSKSV